MIRATISEVKDGMSAYLRRVKAGESVLITERKTPVACLVPVAQVAGGGENADGNDEEARLLRLEQAGVVVRRRSESPQRGSARGYPSHGESPLDALGKPLPASAALMSALLDERVEERGEGDR